MPTPSTAKWPRPRSEDEFEDIVVDFLRLRWKDPNAQRNGRRGQRQYGVDVVGRPAWLNGATAAGQCKNTDSLSLADVVAEAEKAKSFPGGLAEFYVVTSGDRDSKLQAEVRGHFRATPAGFHVEVLFWPDIVSDLSSDDALVAKHWKGFGGLPGTAVVAEPPRWLDREGSSDNETSECHFEFVVRLTADTDIDATELLAELERAAYEDPQDVALRRLLAASPVRTSRGYIWAGDHRAYTNVFEKWGMEVRNGGALVRRWSTFTTHDHVFVETYHLVDRVVLPLANYAHAMEALSSRLGDGRSGRKVSLRLSAHATKPMTLNDNMNIVSSSARYSSPVSSEAWQVELDGDLEVGADRLGLRLLNRAVAEFIEQPDPWAGAVRRALVRVDEGAYFERLSRMGVVKSRA